MPNDFTNPGLLGDSWIGLFVIFAGHGLMEKGQHWSTCHPCCFAACSVSCDRALAESLCLACYINNDAKDIMKSSWPTMEAFTKHWYKPHCSDRMWEWQEISDELSVNPADLVSKICGANLEFWPLPSWPEALKALPKSLPDKQWEEHDERIYTNALVPRARFYPWSCWSLCSGSAEEFPP